MGWLFGKEGGEGEGETKPPFLRTGKFSSEDLRVESSAYQAPDPITVHRASPDAPKPRLEVHRADSPGYDWNDEYSAAGETPEVPAPPNTFYARTSNGTDLFIALLLAIGTTVAVAFTYFGFGLSWDEALYLNPAKNAAEWLTSLASGDLQAFESEAIEKYWGGRLDSQDPNHPEIAPVPKIVIGVGNAVFTRFSVDPMTAMRLPIALFFGLTVGFLYLIGAREYGRIGGVAAALAYALTPRVFGHAHIAASETLLAFSIAFLVWSFLTTISSWPAAIFTAVAFALALDTKVTALFLPLPLFLWGQLYYRGRYGPNVLAMLFISPFIALAFWPWLWHDGAQKFLGYLSFYAGHQSTAIFYENRMWGYAFRDRFGQLITRPPAPWHYPSVITGVSLPEWVLALSGLGLLRALVQAGKRSVPVLFVLSALFLIGLASLPNAPKYDGERLFFPAFLFIALLAGGGFSLFFSAPRGDPSKPAVLRGVISGIFLIAVTLFGAAEISRSHPNELNYFNRIVGGYKGAYDSGFETSYWGEAVNNDVLDYLNANLKPGQRVKALALNEDVFQYLQSWDKLVHGVDFTPPGPADLIILQVRQGFLGEFERNLRKTQKPLQVFGVQDVPKIEIYSGVGGTSPTISAGPGNGVISTTTHTLTMIEATTETTAEAKATTSPESEQTTNAKGMETSAAVSTSNNDLYRSLSVPLLPPIQHPHIQTPTPTPGRGFRPAGRGGVSAGPG